MANDHVTTITPLAYEEHIAGIRHEIARFVDVLRDPRCDATAEAAACPGWRAGDVAVHLGEVQRSWATKVLRGTAAPPTTWDHIEVPDAATATVDELAAWLEDGCAQLVAALEDVASEAPAWSWWPATAPGGHTAGAIARHQLHEAALHRWDAEDAGLGGDGEVDPAAVSLRQACDGVDELLTVTLAAALGPWPADAEPGVLVLRAMDDHGDVARAWTLDCTDGRPVVHDGGASMFTCRVSVAAPDLQLLLWRRPREFGWKGESALFAAFLQWPSYD